ncbi:MAG TPA: hypothetical protein VKU91_00040, partial [Acidimicrobiales bacterium]|nr:hypothetical protein [Acidimicrobiales bacterium]
PRPPDGPPPAPGASSPAEEPPEPAATAGEYPPSTGGPGVEDGGEAFEPTGVHPVLDLTDPRAPVADRSVPDAPPEPSPLAAAPPGRGGGAANGHHSPEGDHRVLAPDPDDEDAGARTPAAWAAASDAPPPAGAPSAAPPAFDAGPATSGAEEPVTAPNAVLRLDEQEDTEVAADERPWVERVTDNDSVRIIRGGTVTATPRSGRSRSRRSGPGGQPGPLRPPAGDGPPSPSGEEPAGDGAGGDGPAGADGRAAGAEEPRTGEAGAEEPPTGETGAEQPPTGEAGAEQPPTGEAMAQEASTGGEVGAGPLAAETEAETPPEPAAETQAETPPDPPAETEAETAPEPAAPAGAGAQTPEPSAGHPPGAPSPSAADVVGGLFARIRAGQPPSAPGTPPVPAAAGAGPAPEAAAGEAAAGEEGGEAEAVLDGDELLLQRRDEAVADVEVALSRRLKRVLQDEQNDLLDRLRGIRGTPKASAVLPALDVQRSALVDAGRRFLDQAATAGVGFGRAMVGSEAAAGAGEAPPVDDLAEEMADLIARPLRRRLEQAFADTAGDDQAVLVGALGAAYREWKTHRIEQLAGDAVAASFSRGSFEAVPPGTPLRWLVEDDDGPCPDCDDNALAGSLLRGELFPTGQAHPPAHAGCRCLLVTANDDS